MKSPSVKFRNSSDSLEAALRGAPPKTEYPGAIHDSIMRSVRAVRNETETKDSAFAMFQRFATTRWLPLTGFAALALLGTWIALRHPSESPTTSNNQSLPEISSAFATSQELMDSLPSVTVGPLSDELDKVNRDLDRTAEFLMATLP